MGGRVGPDGCEFLTFHAVSTPEDLGDLATSTLDLSRTTFGHVASESEIRSHLAAEVAVLAVDRARRRTLGLTLLRIRTVAEFDDARRTALGHLGNDATIGYLHGSVIRPEAQGTGLYRELNQRRIGAVTDAALTHVLTTTQNPKVERGLTSLFDGLAGDGVLAGWSLTRTVLPGMYGRLLTSHQPPADGTPFEVLDREAGDAFALLFGLTYP